MTSVERIIAVEQAASREAESPLPRVWYYGPFKYDRWRPLSYGRDEYGRRTLVVGVLLTGHVVVPMEPS